MKKRSQGPWFFVKPGDSLSNQRLVELLGQDVSTSEQRDQSCVGREPQDGYEVSQEKLALAFSCARRSSGDLNFQYFVRIDGALKPLKVDPTADLGTVQSIAHIVSGMLKNMHRYRLAPKRRKRLVRGAFPKNALSSSEERRST
ncbi:MAG: hypothetical protein AAB365_02150 [Patescibacteria group bacterium]